MRDYRFFYKKREGKTAAPEYCGKSKDKTVHVAMFSDFFSSIPDNMFCTNEKYAKFKEALINTVDVYGARKKVIVELYETVPSDETLREVALIGFRNYIRACRAKLKKQYIMQMLQLSLLAVAGILIMYIICNVTADILPKWVTQCLDNVSCVFLWQFIGFWAFEYIAQKREADQLRQIETIEFNFKLWE